MLNIIKKNYYIVIFFFLNFFLFEFFSDLNLKKRNNSLRVLIHWKFLFKYIQLFLIRQKLYLKIYRFPLGLLKEKKLIQFLNKNLSGNNLEKNLSFLSYSSFLFFNTMRFFNL